MKSLIVIILTGISFSLSTSNLYANDKNYENLIKEKVDILVLAKVIFYEARNQNFAGKLSVCQVVLNRVQSPEFENDIVKVVYSKNQFSWVTKQVNVKNIKNPIEKKAWEEAKILAAKIIKFNFATSLVSNSLFFHSGKTPNFFKKNLEYVKTIGDHKFYRHVFKS